jgi:hypothetical protein
LDIVEIIQQQVDLIAKEKYKDDPCPPVFQVSILYEDSNTHKLIMTITHLGNSFSTILFPQPKMKFGYESIEWEMTQLYNQTM